MGREKRYTESSKETDYGKIMALRRAGWDNAKIADEMGMTQTEFKDALSGCMDMLDKRIRALESCYKQAAGMLLDGNGSMQQH